MVRKIGMRRQPVYLKKLLQTGYDALVVGDEDEVAGGAEAFGREVEGPDQGGAVVRQEILGVVFHHRIRIGVDLRPHALQVSSEFFEPLLPSAGAWGDQEADLDAAMQRVGHRIQDWNIRAAEHGDE